MAKNKQEGASNRRKAGRGPSGRYEQPSSPDRDSQAAGSADTPPVDSNVDARSGSTPVRGDGGGAEQTPLPSSLNRVDHFRVAFDLILSGHRSSTTPQQEKHFASRWESLQLSARTDPEVDSGAVPKVATGLRVAAAWNNGHTAALHAEHILLAISQAHEFLSTRPELGTSLPNPAAFRRNYLRRFRRVFRRSPTNVGSEEKPRYLLTYAEILYVENLLGVDLVAELPPAEVEELGGLDDDD
jgi:hypothetical protein